MKTKTVYICEICNAQFDNEEEALQCEMRMTECPYIVGKKYYCGSTGYMLYDRYFEIIRVKKCEKIMHSWRVSYTVPYVKGIFSLICTEQSWIHPEFEEKE